MKTSKAAVHIVTDIEGFKTYTRWDLYSNRLAKIDVIKYGSNKNPRHMSSYYKYPDKYLKAQITEPLIRGRGHKHRLDLGINKKKQGEQTEKTQKIQSKAIKLEKIDEDLL